MRVRRPLAADGPDALVAERLDDAVRDGPDLPLRAARADDERVGEGRELAEVEQDDVGRLLVLRELDDAPGEVERGAVGRGRRLFTAGQPIGAGRGGGCGLGHVRSVLVRSWAGCGSW